MKKGILSALAALGLFLSACGGAPSQQAAAPKTEVKAEQPAAKEGGAKTLAKPVFIDFYAPW
jgi:ABC-type glycerol-3-phosphate transport system substrate-binding protein